MSDAERTAVHSIRAERDVPADLVVCRLCGASASNVLALSRLPCLFVTVSTT